MFPISNYVLYCKEGSFRLETQPQKLHHFSSPYKFCKNKTELHLIQDCEQNRFNCQKLPVFQILLNDFFHNLLLKKAPNYIKLPNRTEKKLLGPRKPGLAIKKNTNWVHPQILKLQTSTSQIASLSLCKVHISWEGYKNMKKSPI